MKAVVQKLSGFAKFELDHKVNCEQFVTMITAHIDEVQGEAE